MKTIATILAAAVLAGVGSYLLFDFWGAFGLLANNVVVNISVFVMLLLVATVSAAGLHELFRVGVAKADDRLVTRLEARIRALEAGQQPREQVAPPPVAEVTRP